MQWCRLLGLNDDGVGLYRSPPRVASCPPCGQCPCANAAQNRRPRSGSLHQEGDEVPARLGVASPFSNVLSTLATLRPRYCTVCPEAWAGRRQSGIRRVTALRLSTTIHRQVVEEPLATSGGDMKAQAGKMHISFAGKMHISFAGKMH